MLGMRRMSTRGFHGREAISVGLVARVVLGASVDSPCLGGMTEVAGLGLAEAGLPRMRRYRRSG